MFSPIPYLRNLNFSHEIFFYFLSVLNGFSFKLQNRLQNVNKTVIFIEKRALSQKKTQLQIEISGFVKTCDEPLPNQLKVVKSNNNL